MSSHSLKYCCVWFQNYAQQYFKCFSSTPILSLSKELSYFVASAYLTANKKFALMEIRKPTLIIASLMLLGTLWLLVKPTHREKPVLSHIMVPENAWREIQVSLNDYPLHNEEFIVEVNNRGIITKVHAEQAAIVDLLLHRQTIPYLNTEGRLAYYNAELSYQDRYLRGLRSFVLSQQE